MPGKLVWDKIGEHFYETGVDHGVLYPSMSDGQSYAKGIAWSGLTAVTVSPSGADANPFYADNIKYLNLYSPEEFGATIEAYYYPDEFDECNGRIQGAAGVTLGQQPRKAFGFSFRSLIGNDTKANNYSYKIHLIYNAIASPSEQNYNTVNDSPEPGDMSWELTTTPVAIGGNLNPVAHIEVDASKCDAAKLAEFEDYIYGSATQDATLPTPGDVLAFFKGEKEHLG